MNCMGYRTRSATGRRETVGLTRGASYPPTFRV